MQFLVTGYSSKLEYADAIPVQKMINVRSATVSMNSASLSVANQANRFTWRIEKSSLERADAMNGIATGITLDWSQKTNFSPVPLNFYTRLFCCIASRSRSSKAPSESQSAEVVFDWTTARHLI